jgi:putative aldouronate transport system substrate-binding protein
MEKRILAALLIGIICCGALFAGGGSQARASGGAVRITATYPHFGGIPTDTPIGGKAWLELMEKKTGSKLDIAWNYIPFSEYREKMNILLAANDISDLTYITSRTPAIPYERQGLFEDISKHWDKLPNYQAFLAKSPYGMEKVTNSDGTRYFFPSGSLQRKEKGLFIGNPFAIRQDTFQQLNIKPPATTDELLEAGRKLKAAYPDKYPITWWSFALPYTYKTNTGLYWNGSRFVYGPTEDNYRAMLVFLNRLYTEKLLDPETFTQNDETRTRKALNGSNFIQLGHYEDALIRWTNVAGSTAEWAFTLAPTDPAIGPGWQSVWNVNENEINTGESTYIKAGAKNMDLLLRLCDLSYDPEVIRLQNWGLEGVTYTLKPDGKPTYVAKFHEAENFWLVGDDYGIRISSKYRPGLQGPADYGAIFDVEKPLRAYLNGQYVMVKWPEAFDDRVFPTDPWVPPHTRTPPVQFTPDEANANSTILTAVQTYIDEQRVKFITGDADFNQWNDYLNRIKSMNIDSVLDMYNRKAAAFR